MIRFLSPDHPLQSVNSVLRNRLEHAQTNLLSLHTHSAGDLCEQAFDAVRIVLAVPKSLYSEPLSFITEQSFGDLTRFFETLLIDSGFPEQTVLLHAVNLSQRVQLLQAVDEPDEVIHAVEEKVSGVVLNRFAKHELGHLHEDGMGAMRGNVRVPEPRGIDQETLDPLRNPFPGADVVQPPWSEAYSMRFHQLKSKTGSAKGGDGRRLGEQLLRLQQIYGGEIYYHALIGNTLVGHRSKAGVEKAAPSVIVLVGEPSFRVLTGSSIGAQLLLRVYQTAFTNVARRTGYSLEMLAGNIVSTFQERSLREGDGFLEVILKTVTEGVPENQDSRLFNQRIRTRGKKLSDNE